MSCVAVDEEDVAAGGYERAGRGNERNDGGGSTCTLGALTGFLVLLPRPRDAYDSTRDS